MTALCVVLVYVQPWSHGGRQGPSVCETERLAVLYSARGVPSPYRSASVERGERVMSVRVVSSWRRD